MAAEGLGYDGVAVKVGDGYCGWPDHGPCDAIPVKEAVNCVPEPLLALLKPCGCMVVPVGPAEGGQELTMIEKDEDAKVHRRIVRPVRVSLFLGGDRI